jgi:hypothetical protein
MRRDIGEGRRCARFAALALALLTAFAPNRAPAEWSYLGLGNHGVTALELHDDTLYAGTRAGVFARGVDAPDTLWASLGLEDRQVRALLVLDAQTLLAGTFVFPPDTVSIFRSGDGGATWLPYQNGFGSSAGAHEVRSLEALPGSDTDLLGAGPGIEKSVDSGASWRPVGQPYLVNFVQPHPHVPGLVWAGGESFIFAPVVSRSLDGGDTWEDFHLQAGGDNACDAIAFHPTDPGVVYVGMEGRVMRTLDAGATWETVTSPNPGLYLLGMGIPARLPLRVYAAGSGTPVQPGVLLYVSDDGGTSWMTLQHPAPVRFGVTAFRLLTDGATDTLFLGTDYGVYRYRVTVSETTGRTWTDVKRAYR